MAGVAGDVVQYTQIMILTSYDDAAAITVPPPAAGRRRAARWGRGEAPTPAAVAKCVTAAVDQQHRPGPARLRAIPARDIAPRSRLLLDKLADVREQLHLDVIGHRR